MMMIIEIMIDVDEEDDENDCKSIIVITDDVFSACFFNNYQL